MSRHLTPLLRASLLFSLSTGLVAQDDGFWKRPPEPIASLVNAEPTPQAGLSPCRRFLLIVHREGMPSIAVVARPHEKLAGIRIDPKARGPQLGVSTTKLVLRRLEGGAETTLAVPAGHVGAAQWSADGERIAFTRATDAGTELWIAASATGACRKVEGVRLNGVLGSPVQWMPDQKTLLCRLAMPGEPPARPVAPPGPAMQETGGGKKAQVRTTPDLLQNETDAALFEFFAKSRLAFVPADGGPAEPFGPADLISDADPSPDGAFILVDVVRRPFSYLVASHAFPNSTQVWDRAGKIVKTIAETPLRESTPIGGVPEGIRGVGWLPVQGHVLRWTVALDGGDPKRKVPHRDETFVLVEPTGESKSWFKSTHRAGGVSVGEDGRLALVSEMDRDTKRQTVHRADAGDFDAEPKLLYERSIQDAYGDPGAPVMRRLADGRQVVRMSEGRIFRSGAGASKDGERPFLDVWNPTDGTTARLWQAAEGRYETFGGFMDERGGRILVRSESPSEPPQDLALDLATGERVVLTNFGDPALAYTSKIKKELLKYRRADDIPLSGTLYTPPDWTPGTKLPVFVWAYPLEYAQAADAGQVRASPTRYVRLGGASHLWLLLAGYAVLDNAAMPIVGPPKSANDTFIQQVKWNAEAAAKALIDHGVGDPARIAVGGHSYGAFMTANLLCHTDVFAAGVARSGAYNRTLTPFGFQNEERTYWEAPDVYNAMSPFSNATKCNEPILMIHGEDDNNQGTFPIQSQRFYHALKGHGATARLVMLPHESHGYRARESNLHALAETVSWLDKHVKNRAEKPPQE